MKKNLQHITPALVAMALAALPLTASAQDIRSWDFTKWSDETLTNLMADAAAYTDLNEDESFPDTTLWRSREKSSEEDKGDSVCYWFSGTVSDEDGVQLSANSTTIAETAGLYFTSISAGNLAIAIDYDYALSQYEDGQYLWLGGSSSKSTNSTFYIPNVTSGSTLKMGVESHKTSDARGVSVTVENETVETWTPTTYEEFETTITATTDSVDVYISNTNGCHIYYITVIPAGVRSWDFTRWSDETLTNLMADAAAYTALNEDESFPDTTLWRSREKSSEEDKGDSVCYWFSGTVSDEDGVQLSANSTTIAETAGLYFTSISAGNLAIAIDYDYALSQYEDGQYLWLGGSSSKSTNSTFYIPDVASGSTLKMGVESHKASDARGVSVTVEDETVETWTPTTYEEFETTITATTDSVDVYISNTNGCHIYYITVINPDGIVTKEEEEEVSNISDIDWTWDFTEWSDETLTNLIADAAAYTALNEDESFPDTTLWRSREKSSEEDKGDSVCYWFSGTVSNEDGVQLSANGTKIAETAGLYFTAINAGSLAIAIDYDYALNSYETGQYLWLGGSAGYITFYIPDVAAGDTLKMGIESHKSSSSRGVTVTYDDTTMETWTPTTYEEFETVIDSDNDAVDVYISNTNGCHIYGIYISDYTKDESGDVITGISDVTTATASDTASEAIYTLSGIQVRQAGEGTTGLSKGIYIQNGKKVVIK